MKPVFLYSLILAGVLAMACALTITHLDRRAPQDDARQFARMAYSLTRTGVLSTDDPQKKQDPAPSARREPLYPALMALSLTLFAPEDLERNGGRCLTEEGLCPQTLQALRMPNIVLHMVLALATGYVAWLLTASAGAVLAAASITALFSGYISESNILYAETLGALGVLTFSAALFRLFSPVSTASPPPERRTEHRKSNIFPALLCGASFGLLILVKAVFLYLLLLFGFAAAVLGLAAGLSRPARQRGALRGAGRLALIFLAAAAIIAPWMARNHAIGQGWSISGRGDEVLAIRASYDSMPWADVPATFFAVIPVAGEVFVKRIFGEETWQRFDRESPSSYYRRAKTGQSAAHDLAAQKNIPLQSAAMETIRNNAAKHMALTAAFAFSGMMPQLYMRQQDLPGFLLIPSLICGILFVPAALGLGIFAAGKKS